MARKVSSGKVANAQQSAPDLGVELSMADFESMISDAALELAGEQKALESKLSVQTESSSQSKTLADSLPEMFGDEKSTATSNPPRAANVESQPVFIPQAANDLKKGNTIDPFGRKPSSSMYWGALLISILWLAAGYFVATRLFGAELFMIDSINAIGSRPNLVGSLVAMIVPIIGFWSFAVLLRRSQEMRIAAQSLTDVAYRLVDPEIIAEERLSTISQAVRREVAAMSDGIERTLSRAVELESLLHTEVNELERAYSDNEGRMRGLLDGLGNERQSIIGQAERVRTTLAGAREQLTEELNNAVETLRTGVASVSSDLSLSLDLSRDGLLMALQETGQDVETRINERTNALNAAIATSGDKIAAMLDERSHAFAESGENVSRSLAQAIDTKSESLVANLTNATDRLSTEFDTRFANVEANLLGRGQQIISDLDLRTASLNEGTDRLNSALDERARQINETLSQRTREIAQTFVEGRDSFGSLIVDGKQSIAEELQGFVISAGTVIDDSADRLARRVADIRTDLEGNLTAEVDRVEATLTSHRDTFGGRLDGFESSFAAKTAEFDQRISNHATMLDRSISSKSDELDSKMATHVASFGKVMSDNAENLVVAVSGSVVDFEATLANRVADLRRTVEEGSASLEFGMATATDRLAATLTDQTAAFDHVVAERSSELAASLGARSLEIETAIDAATDRAAVAFEGRTDFISGQTTAMEIALQRGMDGVATALENASRNAGETLRSAVKEATTSLYAQATEASQLLGDRQQNLAERLSSAIENTEVMLSDRVGSLEATFTGGQERLAGKAEELGNRLGDLENVFERADQQILMRTQKTSEELNARAGAINAALETFDTGMASRLTGIESTVTLKADATVARIEEASRLIERSAMESGSLIEQRSRELSTSLASHSMEIARILNDTGEPLAARIESGGAAFNALVSQATNSAIDRVAVERENLASLLKSQSEEAAALFEARTAEASTRSRELANSLSNQVNQLVDRLANSNLRLGQLVDLTSKSFIEIDDRLTATTDTFGTRTEKAARDISTSVSMLEGNVGRLSDLSSGTLGEVAGIVNRFDDHSRTLQRANELLTAAQNNLQHTLEDRREALDALTSSLVVRSKEIETVLGAMSGQIEATLERSENRTRSSAAALQNTVSAVFESATAKFADATLQLEAASNSIRDELDATRNDLRRGLTDLPQETKQTTETLRKAVSDQIGALRELSDVMSKNARDRDIREPAAPAPRRALAEKAPAFVESRAPVTQPPLDTRNVERALPTENKGWVSTLLRSASQSDAGPLAPRAPAAPQREPNQVIDSLNSISVDIARAIDHNAAVNLWERYRRGERDVFTRRLYTLRGQETFDDIRRKYEDDREFRLSVTRYCEDFEKLLSDVSRADPEGKVAQRYLTSDTGKVYTMLAHASGRLR